MSSSNHLPIPEAARELPPFTETGGVALWLEPSGSLPFRVVVPHEHALASRVERETETTGDAVLHYAEPNAVNAQVLRGALEWLTPEPIGLATPAGFGGRLGVATPGHVRATPHFDKNVTPSYAQQSIRELACTNCSLLMDDATWGVFAGGWRRSVGADADHTLTPPREAVLRTAAKYGRAVLHVAELSRHLAAQAVPSELEVSVDETETPTSYAEHEIVALELLQTEQGAYSDVLSKHFKKHFTPSAVYDQSPSQESA